MDTDSSRFWFGTGLAVLGLIPPIVEFVRRDFTLAILFTVVLLLMFALFYVSLFSGRGPQYETLLMKKVLTIQDRDGHLAEVRREQTIHARYGNLQGIWWKGNLVDGSMSEYKVDGDDPDEVEPLGSSLSFYKRFTNPLSKGEERTIFWSYKAANSFSGSNEAFIHDTIPGTKQLEMEINFPDQRKCASAEFHVEVAGHDTHTLDGLRRIANGKQLIAVVKWPKAGHTYRVDWRW